MMRGTVAQSAFLLLAVVIASCAPTAAPRPPAATAPPAAQVATVAGWDDVVAAAKREGLVVIAGPLPPAHRDAIHQFQQAYPDIKIEYQGMLGRDFAPKVLSEQRAGQYLWDVHIGGANTMFVALSPAGALDELPRDLPETLPRANDDKWRRGFEEGFLDETAKYAYAFGGYLTFGIYVNRDFVPEAVLARAEDLVKPELVGKISWNEPREPGSGSLAAQRLLLSLGTDSFRKLVADQDITVTRDVRQQVEWLVRGRYPVGLGADSTVLLEFQKEGVGGNVKPLVDPAAISYTNGWGGVVLVKNAPHPNASRVFINWLLSKDGQTAWVTPSGVNSRRLDAPVGDRDRYAAPEIDHPFINKERYEPDRKRSAEIATELLK